MSNKIGIGVITVDREHFFKQCAASLPLADEVVIIHNGIQYKCFDELDSSWDIQSTHKTNNVAINKNRALRSLIDKGCDHLFLCEDDIRFTPQARDLCKNYIHTSEESGIWHLNYGAHGFYNKKENGELNIKQTMEYDDYIKVDFYQNILGAWSYYHKSIIDKCGYMDQRFNNAMEHVEHTYQIIKKNFHPPFWWFADMHRSYDFIQDIVPDHQQSKIREDSVTWQNNMNEAFSLYLHKHGHTPVDTPQSDRSVVEASLQTLHTYCRRKVL